MVISSRSLSPFRATADNTCSGNSCRESHWTEFTECLFFRLCMSQMSEALGRCKSSPNVFQTLSNESKQCSKQVCPRPTTFIARTISVAMGEVDCGQCQTKYTLAGSGSSSSKPCCMHSISTYVRRPHRDRSTGRQRVGFFFTHPCVYPSSTCMHAWDKRVVLWLSIDACVVSSRRDGDQWPDHTGRGEGQGHGSLPGAFLKVAPTGTALLLASSYWLMH